MAELRPNRAKRKLQAGEPVLSFAFGRADSDMIDMLGSRGLMDVAWIEMEHGPHEYGELSDISRACDLWGITSLARPNFNHPGLIGRILDRGVQSVLVPHVNTKEEAELAVRGALYAPKGMRGFGGSRQSYGVADYYKKANDELMVGILIEDVVAIRNLKDILTVDGIDFVYVGTADLAQTMGAKYLGDYYHPDVLAVLRDAVKTITAAGCAAGTNVSEDTLEEMLQLGVRFIQHPVGQYVIQGMERFQSRVSAVRVR